MLNKIVSSEINSYVLFFRIQQYLLPQILQRTEVPEALPRFLEMSYRKQIRKLMFLSDFLQKSLEFTDKLFRQQYYTMGLLVQQAQFS